MDYWKKVIVFLDWILGCMKQKVGKKNKPKLAHGSLIAWGSLEERRNNFQNRTHRACFFFHVTAKKKKKKKKSRHALTVTSSANIILKVWLTNRAFFLKLKKLEFFFWLFDFSASWGQEKETGVPLLVWNFNRCLYPTLYIRVQVFELSTWSYHAAPLFLKGTMMWTAHFSYQINIFVDRKMQGHHCKNYAVQLAGTSPSSETRKPWTWALEICLNPDFWPQECH